MIVERLSLRKELQEQGGGFPVRGGLKGVHGDRGVRYRETGREGGRVEYETPLRTEKKFRESATYVHRIEIQNFCVGTKRSRVRINLLRSNPHIHPFNLQLLIFNLIPLPLPLPLTLSVLRSTITINNQRLTINTLFARTTREPRQRDRRGREVRGVEEEGRGGGVVVQDWRAGVEGFGGLGLVLGERGVGGGGGGLVEGFHCCCVWWGDGGGGGGGG